MRDKGSVVCGVLGFVLIALLSSFTPSLRAQSSSTGSVTGTVTDQSGAVLPGANVVLLSPDTGQTRTATTSNNGNYRFALLAPGTFTVKFSAAGFKTREASVVVNVTETPVLDGQLEIGESSQQVTVTGEAEAVETRSAANGTLVDSQTITAIPLSTRNFTQVISLSTGAVSPVNNAAKLGKGTNEVSVNGLPASSNNYQMDGSDANQWASNTAADGVQFTGLAIPNPDAIAEFKIQTSQFDAGYGRSAGANVNVVTKSGTNDFHGTAFEFLRNDIFNANEFFRKVTKQSRPVLKQNQFGGTLGGPIRKNKFFFFGSYQGTRQTNGLDPSALSTATGPPLTNDRSAATIGSQFCRQTNHPHFYDVCRWHTGGLRRIEHQSSGLENPANEVARRLLRDSGATDHSVEWTGTLFVQHSFQVSRGPVYGQHRLCAFFQAHFVGAVLLLPATSATELHARHRRERSSRFPGDNPQQEPQCGPETHLDLDE